MGEGTKGGLAFRGMSFEDPDWSHLTGGYRVPYDPRDALRSLEEPTDTNSAWDELWNNLHHQGDVGEASYPAVPHLVRIHEIRGTADWNTYALVATIEDVRHKERNPAIPGKLRAAYDDAWQRLVKLGLRELPTACEEALIVGIISVLAMGKRQFSIGRFAVALTEDERRETLQRAGCG